MEHHFRFNDTFRALYPPSSGKEEYKVYLGVKVTKWEWESLPDYKHQIHATILHEHGLVDRNRATASGVALPMIDGRPIFVGETQDEAVDAIIRLLPVGSHFESDDGLDDFYVWSRRGTKAKLVIRRTSKTRAGDLIGLDAFLLEREPLSEHAKSAQVADGGERRSRSTTVIEAGIPVRDGEKTGRDLPDNASDTTIVVADNIDESPVFQHTVSRSASLSKVPLPEVVRFRPHTAGRTAPPASDHGELPRKIPSGTVDETAGQPSRKKRRTGKFHENKHTALAARVESLVEAIGSKHQRDEALTASLAGTAAWKDQAEFDLNATPDLIVRRGVTAEQYRREALQAISPLSSPGLSASSQISDGIIPSLLLARSSVGPPNQEDVMSLPSRVTHNASYTSTRSADVKPHAGRKRKMNDNASSVCIPPFNASPRTRMRNPLVNELVAQSQAQVAAGQIKTASKRSRKALGKIKGSNNHRASKVNSGSTALVTSPRFIDGGPTPQSTVTPAASAESLEETNDRIFGSLRAPQK